ncbi:MAG: tetratricopeptide repeat protein [Candidatus Omnitrophica bacterium]|nr:tetratricopeptide repeat protein [Candidatus Omnitrophota bacterium]
MIKKAKIRIFISIFSLIFFLALLEIGLRTAGYFYSRKIISRTKAIDESQPICKILCIGDSYTAGEAGRVENSYPRQLEGMLFKNSINKFEVINGGVCESNSTQALKHLSRLIKSNKPDHVIFLVGATNRFNLAGYNQGSIKDIIYNLRIYKMLRILRTNLKGKFLRWKLKHSPAQIKKLTFPEDDGGNCEEIKKAIELDPDQPAVVYAHLGNCYRKQRRLKEAEEVFKKALELNPQEDLNYAHLGNCYRKQRRLKEAEEMFKKALELKSNRGWTYLELGNCYQIQGRLKEAEKMYKKTIEVGGDERTLASAYRELGEVYIEQGRYDTAFESLCKGIEVVPEDFQSYYNLARAHELQSKYGSDYILDAFQRIIENNPGLGENSEFSNYTSLFKNRESWEKKIDRWLRQDLEKIVRLCQENGIKLIIQNYPYPYFSANKALRDTAIRYSLLFVDNYSLFNKLVDKEGREKYFVDSDHCTAEGHKIMTENIYKALVSEGIVLENTKEMGNE